MAPARQIPKYDRMASLAGLAPPAFMQAKHDMKVTDKQRARKDS